MKANILDKVFVLVTDSHGKPVHLNLQHVSSVQRQGKDGVLVIMADGEKLNLLWEEAAKLAPYLIAMTHKREPMITK